MSGKIFVHHEIVRQTLLEQCMSHTACRGHDSGFHDLINFLTLKRRRRGGQFNTPCGFSKNVFSKESLKPWFLVSFNVITRRTFPENFIEISLVVRKT